MDFHKRFKKQFSKIPPKIQNKFFERVELLNTNYLSPSLHYHQLVGAWHPLYSINVTGDYRALFEYKENEELFFHRIGTHAQLYG